MSSNQALLSAVGARFGTHSELYLLLSRMNNRATGGGGGGGANATIIFRPGPASTGPYYQTWAEVEAAVAAVGGDCTVVFDASSASITIPATANLDGHYLVNLAGGSGGVNAPPVVATATIATVMSGAKFHNVRSVTDNIIFEGALTTPLFVMDDPGRLLSVEFGAGFRLLMGATSPFYTVTPGTPAFLRVDLGGLFDNSAVPGVPIVDASSVVPGSAFGLIVTRAINAQPASIKGSPGTLFLFVHDASTNQQQATDPGGYATGFTPPFPGGNDVFFDTAEGVRYDDLKQLPAFDPVAPNAYNVQKALDKIKLLLPATASQNVIVFDHTVGASFGNVYKTWPEVQAAASAANGPLTIMFVPNCVMTTPGLDYTDNLLLIGDGGYGPNPTPIIMDNQTGGIPANWNMLAVSIEIRDLAITTRTSDTAPFEGGSAGCQVLLSGTTTIQNDPTSLARSFSFHGSPGPGPTQVARITLKDQARLIESVLPIVVSADTGGGSTASFELYAYDQSVVEENTIDYQATGGLITDQGDGAVIEPVQFAPPLLTVGLIEPASSTSYDDTVVTPLLVADTVQEALDKLKRRGGPVYYSADLAAISSFGSHHLPPGSGPIPLSLLTTGGVIIPRDMDFSSFAVSHRSTGGNVGITISYTLQVNGVLFPASDVVLSAGANASGSSAFNLSLSTGDRVQVFVVIGGVLDTNVTSLEASIG